ncbi:MAG: hypothetical protein ABIF82_14215 [Planctomycetota bacterium]
MYQHTRLYEFSGSIKLVLTGFILAACAAAVMALAGLHYACKDLDGRPEISFKDIKWFIRGADASVLEHAADRPKEYGLRSADRDALQPLKDWSEKGAPRAELDTIRRILKDSELDRAVGERDKKADDTMLLALPTLPAKEFNAEYRRLKALAARPPPLSDAGLGVGIALYLAIVSLAFLGLGMLFARTSMFEKRKIFFVGNTFALILACPIFLWLARDYTTGVYLMLLSLLLLVVCFGVFALVALYDIWFRRTAT